MGGRSWDANRAEFEQALDANALFLAEEDGDAGRLRHRLARGSLRADRRPLRRRGRAGVTAPGSALVETVIENLRAPRRHASVPEREPRSSLAFYEKLGFREESRNLVLPLDGSRAVGETAVRSARSTCRPTTSARSSAPCAVRAAAPGRLARQHRRAAATTAGSRSTTTSCDRDPSVLRRLARELSRPHGRGRARDRRRARAGRPLRPARGRAASSTSTSPCRSTTARCRRAT